MVDPYLWLKAFHIIAVIAWMAALLYLPRLFVYHTQQVPGSPASETFKVMERKLQRIIMTPAMIASLASGLALIWLVYGATWAQEGWLHGKLLLLVGLFAVHMAFAGWRRAFAEDRNTHSERFFRIMNEVPTLLMIFVVVLVVVKPL